MTAPARSAVDLTPDELFRRISGSVPGLFACSPAPFGRVRVKTPMLYPDGGIVDVFVEKRGATWRLTDLGEALGWLGLQSVSDRRSPEQDEMIEEVCRAFRVTLRGGELELPVAALDDLGDTVLLLAQAVARVADASFLERPGRRGHSRSESGSGCP